MEPPRPGNRTELCPGRAMGLSKENDQGQCWFLISDSNQSKLEKYLQFFQLMTFYLRNLGEQIPRKVRQEDLGAECRVPPNSSHLHQSGQCETFGVPTVTRNQEER